MFEDEIRDDLKHTGAGILSMTNRYKFKKKKMINGLLTVAVVHCSGPNTNGSQFFITLAPTQWLDGECVQN